MERLRTTGALLELFGFAQLLIACFGKTKVLEEPGKTQTTAAGPRSSLG